MPYKDKLRQREAQREFARRKAAKAKALRPAITLAEGEKNWRPLLPKPELAKLTTFKACAIAASKFIVKGKTNCMAVAAIALRVCEIEQGGPMRGVNRKNLLTIKKFAHAIGVNYKTLYGWIEAQRFAAKHLPDETKHIAYTAIRDTIYYARRTGQNPEELYKRFATKSDPKRGAFQLIKRIRYGLKFLKMHGLEPFEDVDIDLLRCFAKVVHGMLPENIKATQQRRNAAKNWVEDAAEAVQ